MNNKNIFKLFSFLFFLGILSYSCGITTKPNSENNQTSHKIESGVSDKVTENKGNEENTSEVEVDDNDSTCQTQNCSGVDYEKPLTYSKIFLTGFIQENYELSGGIKSGRNIYCDPYGRYMAWLYNEEEWNNLNFLQPNYFLDQLSLDMKLANVSEFPQFSPIDFEKHSVIAISDLRSSPGRIDCQVAETIYSVVENKNDVSIKFKTYNDYNYCEENAGKATEEIIEPVSFSQENCKLFETVSNMYISCPDDLLLIEKTGLAEKNFKFIRERICPENQFGDPYSYSDFISDEEFKENPYYSDIFP